jgi:hypothetical protein
VLNTLHNKATVVLLCYFFYVLDFYMQTTQTQQQQVLQQLQQHYNTQVKHCAEDRASAEHKQLVTFCKLLTEQSWRKWTAMLTAEQTAQMFPTFDHWLDCAPK